MRQNTLIRLHNSIARSCAMATLAAIIPTGLQAQIQWGGNGHWYQVVTVANGIDWTDANSSAQSMGGYLASATSAAENDFIFSLVDQAQFWTAGPNAASFGPWIGGHQPNGIEPDGWEWTTGETWQFTMWAPGEPNQSGGREEDYVHYFLEGQGRARTWNDLSDDGSDGLRPVAFVVETVPEPSSLAILACGVAPLMKRIRKSNQKNAKLGAAT